MLKLVLCEFVSVWEGIGAEVALRLGVGCLCPPVRNDIVAPHHLSFFFLRLISIMKLLSTFSKEKERIEMKTIANHMTSGTIFLT